MTNNKKIAATNGVYFITLSCHQSIPLLHLTAGFDLVYKWFDHLNAYGHCILGYVIMPNHIDAIVGFRNTGMSITDVVTNGKRMIGTEIARRLRDSRELEVLGILTMTQHDVSLSDGIMLWEKSFEWKQCRSNSFIDRQLQCMHEKPGSGNWDLVEHGWDYAHSSAGYYQIGVPSGYPVFDYRQLGSVDLSKPIHKLW